MTHELQKLQEKHKKIIELALEGLSKVQIATELGLTPPGVKLIMDSPVFQGELARRRAERDMRLDENATVVATARAFSASDVLHDAAVRAAKTQVALLDAESPAVVQRAAMDILDRAGFPKVVRNDSRTLGVQIVLDERVLGRLLTATKECFGEVPNFESDAEHETRPEAL